MISLPLAAPNSTVAFIAYIGGLAAASGMLIVETMALSIMVSNNLVMPILIRSGLIKSGQLVSHIVVFVRRVAVIVILALAYLCFRWIGDSFALAKIGFVCFAAVAQLAPALLIGCYWAGGCRIGAITGLVLGFGLWAYTLLIPLFARSGWIPNDFMQMGLFGISDLKPYALFGLSSLDPLSHGLFWSLLFNCGGYFFASFAATPSVEERQQARSFVDELHDSAQGVRRQWDADVRLVDMSKLLNEFMGQRDCERVLAEYADKQRIALVPTMRADQRLIDHVELVLTGVIGSALARVMVSGLIKERAPNPDSVHELLHTATEAIEITWQRLRLAIDNVNQGISMFDSDSRLIVVNRRFLELTQLPEALVAVGTLYEDIARFFWERGDFGANVMAPPDRDVVHRVGELNIMSNGVVLEVVHNPIRGGGLISTYTDITERKERARHLEAINVQLEKRVDERTRDLEESRKRFRELAETASDWFWETDVDGKLTFLSERFAEMTGLHSAAFIGRPLSSLINVGDRHSSDQLLLALGDPERLPHQLKNLSAKLKGARLQSIHLRINAKPAFDDNRTFVGYRGTASDVSALVAAENELMRSEKLASLGRLVAGVAHEINTPVGVSLTTTTHFQDQLKIFRDKYSSGQVRRSDIEQHLNIAEECMNALFANLRRAADLVRSFKQVAVDQTSDQKRIFLVNAYLREIIDSLRPQLKRTKHQLELDIPEELRINSYPGAFAQVVTNLIMNSLIHGFEGIERGNIKIVVTKESNQLNINYSDDGKGMQPDVLERVFEPFFTTKRSTGGSGLGMSIVFNLVTQVLGGTIQCQSKPCAGFIVRIAVPAEEN